jgi:hypothetical protein
MMRHINESNLSIIVPIWRFRPTSGDGGMMADLLRYVAILLVESDVFECFALDELSICLQERHERHLRA